MDPHFSPTGSYNPNAGTTYTIDDCQCSPGYFGGGGADCTACPSGSYTSEFGSASEAACVKALKVCMMFPSFTTVGSVYTELHMNLAGALSAIAEINDHSDGIWDDLLPDTTIFYEWYNDGLDSSTGLRVAIDCVTTAFGGTAADVVIGPSYSTVTMNTQLILANYGVPQVSHRCAAHRIRTHRAYRVAAPPANGVSPHHSCEATELFSPQLCSSLSRLRSAPPHQSCQTSSSTPPSSGRQHPTLTRPWPPLM